MISREDAIDNLKIALYGECSPCIENYQEEIEFAINDMQAMQEIRKYMIKDESFGEMVSCILEMCKEGN